MHCLAKRCPAASARSGGTSPNPCWNWHDRKTGNGYDLVSPANGTRYQVKGSDRARETPRFRFWLSDHLALKRAAQASYILVVYDSRLDDPIVSIDKAPLAYIEQFASWGPSGHDKGRQTKIRADTLV